MEKKIEDYIHLYLGCEVLTHKNKIHHLTDVCSIGGDFQKYHTIGKFDSFPTDWNIDNKLVLRPLSDIKEEEDQEINAEFGSRYLVENLKEGKYYAIDIHQQFDVTKRLLRMGFDLFGLIESGLAIDKTKIK